MTGYATLRGERNPLRRRRTGAGVSPRRPVTFPTTRIVSRVQVALAADLSADPLTWPWADITSKVRQDLGISLTTGRRDEASTVTTGTAQLKLDNRDGRFSRRNPTSPYYGLLSKNTPIWATVDAGSGEKTRLEMFVNEWPTRWSDLSATDSTVTIRCAGILRRLAQGEVLKSPLRRAILALSPAAYWPLEDGSESTFAGPGISGGSAMAVLTAPTFGASNAAAGSAGAIDLSSGGDLSGAVSTSGFVDRWRVEWIARFQTGGSSGTTDVVPVSWASSGISFFFRVWQGFVHLQDQSASGNNFFITVAQDVYDDQWRHYRADVTKNGAEYDASFYIDGVLRGTDSTSGASPALTAVQSTHLEDRSLTTGVPAEFPMVAHLAVWQSQPASSNMPTAMGGFAGEQAHVRMTRLAAEENVLFATTAGRSAAVGPQGIAKFIDLMRDCEAADGGVLYEKRWGLAYKSLDEYYNQPVGLALNFDLGQVGDLPEPADDDQRLRNRWTVSRTNGSEFTAEQATGPMGTGPEGPGVYDNSMTLGVDGDDQLEDRAWWEVARGTVDEDRWPAIGLNFAASPELIDSFTALGYGVRTTVDHPPTQMPPDQLDLIIEGHSERWDPYIWTASLNTSPASPYRIAIVEDPAALESTPRVGSGTAVLAADINTTDTTLSVTTGTGGLWTTTAADFPLDINIAGERIRLSVISGAASPQTFTVSARSVNGVVKAQSAGARIEPWQIATVGL